MNKYFQKKSESSSQNERDSSIKSYSNHYKIGAIALLISFIGAGGKYLYDLYRLKHKVATNFDRLKHKKDDKESEKVRVIV